MRLSEFFEIVGGVFSVAIFTAGTIVLVGFLLSGLTLLAKPSSTSTDQILEATASCQIAK